MPATYTVFICDYCGFKARSTNDQTINIAPESWIIFSTHDLPGGGQALVCGWDCLRRYAKQRAKGGDHKLPYNDQPCPCGEDHPFDTSPRSRTLPPAQFRTEDDADPTDIEDFPWVEGEARIPFTSERAQSLRAARTGQDDGHKKPCADCAEKRKARSHGHAH